MSSVLAFDTSASQTLVSLCVSYKDPDSYYSAVGEVNSHGRPQHAEQLLPLIEQLLRKAKLDFNDIQTVAVGNGPGSFTGLRIALSTAAALGASTDAAVCGVPFPLAVAAQLRRQESATYERMVVVQDGSRGELFVTEVLADTKGSDASPLSLSLQNAAEWVELKLRESTNKISVVCTDQTSYQALSTANLNTDSCTVQLLDPEKIEPAAIIWALAEDQVFSSSEQLPRVNSWPIDPVYVRSADAIPTAERESPLRSL